MSKDRLDQEQTQELEELGQRSVSEVEVVSAIVAEVRNTAGSSEVEAVEEMLRTRLARSSVRLPEDEIQELVTQIRTGDA